MRTSEFDYYLPPHLIAQEPVEPRDHSRLMVVERATGRIRHRRYFYEIAEELAPGDLLVFNDTRVVPARLYGKRADTGGAVELLLLQRLEPGRWHAIGRPGRHLRPGALLLFGEGEHHVRVTVQKDVGEGVREVLLEGEEYLEQVGRVPLPPYIHKPLTDPERYQTVFARQPGSVAAPTAALHFTPTLMERLTSKGVHIAFVTLHIGLDTFRPVRTENPREHKLHGEPFTLPPETAQIIAKTKENGRRVVAVGTTVVRVLEHVATAYGQVRPASGWADLYILPGYQFKVVDALVTNFHLPRTTLLMLVCAFAGRDLVLRAYQEAVQEGYRFYSFGDAMFLDGAPQGAPHPPEGEHCQPP
ncbi:MAG: tRNA preQ1(34) S-adenosylmethionine ribosyltransferase-isomerase QueA [Chloroflexota bacterium]|nr:tRNA preQ1(34) S-adenosylmethionine ribosyltransferase-isomerase QueA [Chloroflexota bacterium]